MGFAIGSISNGVSREVTLVLRVRQYGGIVVIEGRDASGRINMMSLPQASDPCEAIGRFILQSLKD